MYLIITNFVYMYCNNTNYIKHEKIYLDGGCGISRTACCKRAVEF